MTPGVRFGQTEAGVCIFKKANAGSVKEHKGANEEAAGHKDNLLKVSHNAKLAGYTFSSPIDREFFHQWQVSGLSGKPSQENKVPLWRIFVPVGEIVGRSCSAPIKSDLGLGPVVVSQRTMIPNDPKSWLRLKFQQSKIVICWRFHCGCTSQNSRKGLACLHVYIRLLVKLFFIFFSLITCKTDSVSSSVKTYHEILNWSELIMWLRMSHSVMSKCTHTKNKKQKYKHLIRASKLYRQNYQRVCFRLFQTWKVHQGINISRSQETRNVSGGCKHKAH